MKCSICGGNVTSTQYCVYRSDGSISGKYSCDSCGAEKPWKIKGSEEFVIDMGEEEKMNDKECTNSHDEAQISNEYIAVFITREEYAKYLKKIENYRPLTFYDGDPDELRADIQKLTFELDILKTLVKNHEKAKDYIAYLELKEQSDVLWKKLLG